MESPFIMFEGPGLAGCRELAVRLGWLDPNWFKRDLPGPTLVRWHDRALVMELGYRGPNWTSLKFEYRERRDDSLRLVVAVLFVADSQRVRLEANLERLEQLDSDLGGVGRAPSAVPVVFALNKRDLEGKEGAQLLSVDELRAELRWPVCRYVETSAFTGRGVDAAVAQLFELADAIGT